MFHKIAFWLAKKSFPRPLKRKLKSLPTLNRATIFQLYFALVLRETTDEIMYHVINQIRKKEISNLVQRVLSCAPFPLNSALPKANPCIVLRTPKFSVSLCSAKGESARWGRIFFHHSHFHRSHSCSWLSKTVMQTMYTPR
jgi:hypothetical protein